jgi:hypothetical protein
MTADRWSDGILTHDKLLDEFRTFSVSSRQVLSFGGENASVKFEAFAEPPTMENHDAWSRGR